MLPHPSPQLTDALGQFRVHLGTFRLDDRLPQTVKDSIEGLTQGSTIGLISWVKMARNRDPGNPLDGGVDVLMT
ncbi:MAG: hypothetical protein E7K05_24575 [Serratia marcescens]|nr:hypothetical protein [Serratia marcescens]